MAERKAYACVMRSTLGRRVTLVGVAMAGALASGFVAAIVLAIADLYVTGHGAASLMRPWLQGAVSMSRADVIFYLAVVMGGGLAWLAAGRGLTPSPTRE